MANNIRINRVGLDRFLNRTVQPYLRRKAEEIADEARRTAPLGATGELRNSISVIPGAGGNVQIRISADHAGFVTYGTGPQAIPPRPAYFPKLRRRGLILWSDSKGLNPYAVARGIAAHGTAPNPFFEESIQRVLGKFNFRWINRNIET